MISGKKGGRYASLFEWKIWLSQCLECCHTLLMWITWCDRKAQISSNTLKTLFYDCYLTG
jgi:hypothetical protein